MSPEVILLYIVIGIVAGLITGLLGGGSGLILIPAIIAILQAKGINPQIQMHIAIGTTVLVIIVSASFSCITHHKNRGINWAVFKRIALGCTIGCVIGSLIAHKLPSQTLMLIFGIAVILLALWVWFGQKEKTTSELQHPNAVSITGSGGFIGLVSSILGINPFTMPYLRHIGFDLRRAVGTSVAVGTLMATVITIMFIITGWNAPGLPPYSTGFVDWSIGIPFAVATTIGGILGAKLAYAIPRDVLKLLYCLLMIVIGIHMLMKVCFC